MKVRYILEAEFPDRTNPKLPRIQLAGIFDLLGAKVEILNEEVTIAEEYSAEIIEYPKLRVVRLEADAA